jgi:RimJ/RimL family protein N-acetyltransferase
MSARAISKDERFEGDVVALRLATQADCTPTYVAWLADPDVNRYLETRWTPQDLDTVRAFVAAMESSADSYLFAILERGSARHVGNLKVGPIHARHSFADVSYFIGDRTVWGQGYASDAIRVATSVAFTRLGLHRVQAGLYASNRGSARALEKAGYLAEGRFAAQLRGHDGWEDHVWYGRVRDEPAR